MSDYDDFRRVVKDEQTDLPYDEIRKQMEKSNEAIAELDNLPPQKHLWTDRGEKLTCENAGHSYHEAWKRRKSTV
jgi:hypothetical protein